MNEPEEFRTHRKNGFGKRSRIIGRRKPAVAIQHSARCLFKQVTWKGVVWFDVPTRTGGPRSF